MQSAPIRGTIPRTTDGWSGPEDPRARERFSQGVVPARGSPRCRSVGKRLRVLPPEPFCVACAAKIVGGPEGRRFGLRVSTRDYDLRRHGRRPTISAAQGRAMAGNEMGVDRDPGSAEIAPAPDAALTPGLDR